MSEDAPASPVSLVSSFSAANYPYPIVKPYPDSNNVLARSSIRNDLRAAVKFARIKDYKIFKYDHAVGLYLRKPEDVERYVLATTQETEIELEYATFHKGYDYRKMKRLRHKLQAVTDAAGFGDSLLFDLDRKKRCVVFLADSRDTYFRFCEFEEEYGLKDRLMPDRLTYPDAKPEKVEDIVRRMTLYHDKISPEAEEVLEQEALEAAAREEFPPSTRYIPGDWNDDMQGPRKVGHLSLVRSFHISDYIYSFNNALDDPQDGAERALVMRKFRGTVENAGIKDYKLMERDGEIALYLRTPEDVNRFNVVRHSGDQIEEEFVTFEDGFDYRKIKRLTRHLQALSDQAGFGDTILFGAARNLGGIVILGSPKKSYFEFADHVRDNMDKFQRFFDLQKKEPELEIATPTRQNFTPPNIIIESEKPKPQRAPSERFIRGFATNETVTPPEGEAVLVKSMTQANYPWQLTPAIAINPEKNQMDKLCQNLPDYEEFKLQHKGAKIVDGIRTAMDGANVDDYSLHTDRGRIEAHFKHPRDLAVAYASLYPSMQHLVDFVECSRNTSPMKMQTKAKKLQAIFAEVGNVDVTFICDMDKKVIKAIVPTTDDLIAMQGIARRLETSSPVFQRIVGIS